MTATTTTTTTAAPDRCPAPSPTGPPAAPPDRRGAAWLVAVILLALAAFALADIVQGTAHVGAADVWKALTGQGTTTDTSVVLASRLPRMAAGILVGAALGMSGSALQAISRNVLASPDTLAVNAGAYLALGLVTVTGVAVPFLAGSAAAFAGGLAASALVLALSGLGSGTVRLVLAGSALAMGFGSVTDALILLFPNRTEGLYQWGQGGIAQNGFADVRQMAPVVLAGLVGLCLIARRVDALALGDDAARGLGVPVRGTRIVVVILTSLLAAAAVSLAGPIGYVGLCAPALVRPLSTRLRAFARSRNRVPMSGLVGAALVLGSDVLLRAAVGADLGVAVPTGTVTSLVGAVFLIVIAVRAREAGETAEAERLRIPGRMTFLATVAVLACLLVGVLIAALLLGDTPLLLGDVTHWIAGTAPRSISFMLDTRAPRVLAAFLAGTALALSGTLVQAVTSNPLAEPGILGVSGGGAVGAVVLTTSVSMATTWSLAGAALIGSGVAAALVFGLCAQGGFRSNRLVLVGTGVSAASTALIGLILVLADPFNATKALTWLSGSTYGRAFPDALPVGITLAVVTILAVAHRRELDLIALHEDQARLFGLRLGHARLGFLAASVLLTATAVAAAGTIGFVGLVAPHTARSLVGRRHARVVPVAMLLGGVLVTTADLVGRTVIVPQEIGAGLVTAVIGTPYFVYLLVRTARR
ncbi:iron ABC transporter permease [Actinospica durhamensis]|uniref:Iron ABC transporter permease n=1 Tax=Actinospica durhamensis TaxID=1508375 RepID=A0A941ET31_9ACTN|nr:iron ABC transporter permease [Actinospica durhamensis]MBR7836791.1 iron ABC transporter permease [Actinospica durhamensis]